MRGWLRNHPFLTLGLASFVCLGVLLALDPPGDSNTFAVLVTAWETLGYGPHAAANLLARHAPTIPDGLDVALVVFLGLLPYAAADYLVRSLRAWSERKRLREEP